MPVQEFSIRTKIHQRSIYTELLHGLFKSVYISDSDIKKKISKRGAEPFIFKIELHPKVYESDLDAKNRYQKLLHALSNSGQKSIDKGYASNSHINRLQEVSIFCLFVSPSSSGISASGNLRFPWETGLLASLVLARLQSWTAASGTTDNLNDRHTYEGGLAEMASFPLHWLIG